MNFKTIRKTALFTLILSGMMLVAGCNKDKTGNDPFRPDEATDITTAFEGGEFLNICLSQFDTNKDGKLTYGEVAHVEKLEVTLTKSSGNRSASNNLKGVEYFTALKELVCERSGLTAIDVSKNTALTKLWCSDNQLAALDVSKNTKLAVLDCYVNNFTVLDVSNNTELKEFYCSDNKLTTLDMSKNTKLVLMECHNNNLTILDVSHNTALKVLWCPDNQLTSLDVSHNTALTALNCGNNPLSILYLPTGYSGSLSKPGGVQVEYK